MSTDWYRWDLTHGNCTCGDLDHPYSPATVTCLCGFTRDRDEEECPACQDQQKALWQKAERREAGLRARRSNQHPKARLKGWRR